MSQVNVMPFPSLTGGGTSVGDMQLRPTDEAGEILGTDKSCSSGSTVCDPRREQLLLDESDLMLHGEGLEILPLQKLGSDPLTVLFARLRCVFCFSISKTDFFNSVAKSHGLDGSQGTSFG